MRTTSTSLALSLILTTSSAFAQPVVHVLEQVYDGSSAGAGFGTAVAVIGDMTGDAALEFAIGAPDDDTNGPGAGSVSFFTDYQAPVPIWTIYGEPGDHLGAAISSAEVKGDGKMDAIIGAPGSPDVDPAATGRVVIAFGSSPLGTLPLLSIPGQAPGGRFGAAVAGLGRGVPTDVMERIAIGAPDANSGAGEVRAYHSGSPPSLTPELILHGRGAGDHFGFALAGIGNAHTASFTGSDLLVGAPFNSESGASAGRAYLYYSDAPFDSVPDAEFAGGEPGALFGSSVSGGGLFSAYGHTDILIGAPDAVVAGNAGTGRAYLFGGGDPPVDVPVATFEGTVPGGHFGAAVAVVLPLSDGLGYAVGAPGDPGGALPGQVWFHSLLPSVAPDTTFVGEVPGDLYGSSISSGIRFLVCDHCPNPLQLLVGAPGHGDAGRGYDYSPEDTTTHPGAVGAADPEFRIIPPRPNPSGGRVHLGFSLARAARVSLDIVDVEGRRVARPARGIFEPGEHEFTWSPDDGVARASGLYWAVFSIDGRRAARRFAVLR
jgi:hypothetical protein